MDRVRPMTGPVDPVRWARMIRRLTLPVLVLAFLAFYLTVDFVVVPAGMDTLIGHSVHNPVPPGSTCLLDRRNSSVQVGCPVFVRLDDGSTLLSRVAERSSDDRIVVRNDNPGSRLPDSRSLGSFELSEIVGTVLYVFPPEAREPGDGR